MAKKISPKIQQAAEKYLDSLGSSQEELTEKQREIVANCFKTRRIRVLILLVLGLIVAGVGFWSFQLGKKALASVVPHEADKIIFVSKTGEQSMPVQPGDVKKYTKVVTKLYWNCGACYVLAVFFLTSAFIIVPLSIRENKKILKAFIPRRQEQGEAHLENQISSE